ncbi:MAG TPA: nucleotidyltransferase [bacterium (Candidatus Stahlbacteria)]|nr:nucleotidyltransferase [Candidatus Stahlbacteria bacterium]
MADLKDVIKILRGLQDEVSAEFKAQIIGIFGSYSRSEQDELSDVDIIVRFRDGATLFDLVGVANYLEEQLKIRVDVVSERALRPELKAKIQRELVAI